MDFEVSSSFVFYHHSPTQGLFFDSLFVFVRVGPPPRPLGFRCCLQHPSYFRDIIPFHPIHYSDEVDDPIPHSPSSIPRSPCHIRHNKSIAPTHLHPSTLTTCSMAIDLLTELMEKCNIQKHGNHDDQPPYYPHPSTPIFILYNTSTTSNDYVWEEDRRFDWITPPLFRRRVGELSDLFWRIVIQQLSYRIGDIPGFPWVQRWDVVRSASRTRPFVMWSTRERMCVW